MILNGAILMFSDVLTLWMGMAIYPQDGSDFRREWVQIPFPKLTLNAKAQTPRICGK